MKTLLSCGNTEVGLHGLSTASLLSLDYWQLFFYIKRISIRFQVQRFEADAGDVLRLLMFCLAGVSKQAGATLHRTVFASAMPVYQ
ncbi:hypothetical protein [Undibacterium sp. TS12]|uniref:hypothetical protein n=1 Tax=Undibacterium sp. TS12 TaxID=2908202 RepID=UPI001F4CD897|nr:hypothetical protein [Undibacterium sp. TS12]MCH8621071.1 hypothetical protein [Undibacterium sp. TS12]